MSCFTVLQGARMTSCTLKYFQDDWTATCGRQYLRAEGIKISAVVFSLSWESNISQGFDNCYASSKYIRLCLKGRFTTDIMSSHDMAHYSTCRIGKYIHIWTKLVKPTLTFCWRRMITLKSAALDQAASGQICVQHLALVICAATLLQGTSSRIVERKKIQLCLWNLKKPFSCDVKCSRSRIERAVLTEKGQENCLKLSQVICLMRLLSS